MPTFRESENLPELADRVDRALRAAGVDYELIVVDDDSGDGIEEAAERLREAGRPIRTIVRHGERDLSAAVIRGFREAAGERLVCMDADLSHPPERIPAMLDMLAQPGVDFVIGSRYVEGGSTEEGRGFLRWLNSMAATLLARPFTDARDPMAGFFALRRETFERAAPLDPVGYKIGLELIVKCPCRGVREIPIHFARRKHGQSKLSLRQQVLYLKHLWRLARFTLLNR
mgnify:CR=1 FL=1